MRERKPPRDRSKQREGTPPSARDLVSYSQEVARIQNDPELRENESALTIECAMYANAGIVHKLAALGTALEALGGHAKRVADAAERIAEHLETVRE